MPRTLILIVGFLIATGFIYINNRSAQVAGTSGSISKVSGLILPHHDLAREIIIDSLQKITTIQDPQTIVVLSPNHFRPQSYTFTSTFRLGDFPLAQPLISDLHSFDPNLVLDADLLNNEHGLTVPMTYLHQFFPEARILPLAVSPFFTPDRLLSYAQKLNHLLPPDTLFVASVDFSHEHQALAAADYNTQTISTIQNFEYSKLYSYNNNFLDSPAAIAVLMHIMQLRGTASWQTWHSIHGATLTSDPILQGTSYVIGIFY